MNSTFRNFTFNDATLSDINVVLCYVLSQMSMTLPEDPRSMQVSENFGSKQKEMFDIVLSYSKSHIRIERYLYAPFTRQDRAKSAEKSRRFTL